MKLPGRSCGPALPFEDVMKGSGAASVPDSTHGGRVGKGHIPGMFASIWKHPLAK
jgi:hypothetical protein